MSPLIIAALTAGAFLIALVVTRWLIGALAAGGVMDRPNERSSHTVPTPRGGGLGILAGVLPAWGLTFDLGGAFLGNWQLALGAGLLAVVSWWDDRAGLSWSLRLLVQVVAVTLAVLPLVWLIDFTIASPARETTAALHTFHDVWPQAYLALAVAGICWLGFINAFNFMDGIDGIAAVEAIFVATGCALAFWWLGASATFSAPATSYIAFSLTLAAAAGGFLVWNRPPARIFMGDVGSVPIGFMLGFLLVSLAGAGAWGAALTLPAYFGADAVLTLIRRLRRGARITEPHREHAYQRAAGREKAGHARVLWRVALADASLVGAVAIGLSVGGNGGQALTVLIGALVVGALLFELERLAARPAPA